MEYSALAIVSAVAVLFILWKFIWKNPNWEAQRALDRYLNTPFSNEQTGRLYEQKVIHESHIFQLYGSMTHFKLTQKTQRHDYRAVFFTTAQYSSVAISVAKVLGVQLRSVELNRTYPMIKCNITDSGEKIYHLPFDPYYDKIKVEVHKGEFFAQTVKEAVAKGFRRQRSRRNAA